MVVPAETTSRVAAYMEEILLPHLLRADAVMFSSAQTGHARWIAGLILSRAKGFIATRDIVASYRALRPPEKLRELHAVMDGLASLGWVRPDAPANPSRPLTRWHINPAVLSVFAERAQQEREQRRRNQEHVADLIRGGRRRR